MLNHQGEVLYSRLQMQVLIELKANRLCLRDYPLNPLESTDRQTDGCTHGCYQVHYPCKHFTIYLYPITEQEEKSSLTKLRMLKHWKIRPRWHILPYYLITRPSFTPHNKILASCPWGLATAHGVRILTELYAIHVSRSNGFSYRGCFIHTELCSI